MSHGIDAPDSVPEGTTGPIEVLAPGAKSVRITIPATGDSFDVPVSGGAARFELPAGLTSGTAVIVTDSDDPTSSDGFLIVPSTL